MTKEDFTGRQDSGFFIDEQLACDSMTWTLSAQPWSKTGEVVDSSKGYDDIILRGIINEESPAVSFSVDHEYDSASTGVAGETISKVTQSIDSAWQKLRGADYASKMVGDLMPNNLVGEFFSGAFNTLSDLAGKAGSALTGINSDRATKSSLMLGTEGLKYFSKSNINIEIPTINFRYYNNMYKGKSVLDLVKILNDRLIGKYSGGGTNSNSHAIGTIAAPNGYEGNGVNIIGLDESTIIPGTFCLEYAGRRIPNLIVKNYSIKESTTKVLEVDNNKNLVVSKTPIYCDIEITLEPVVIYTRESLKSVFADPFR